METFEIIKIVLGSTLMFCWVCRTITRHFIHQSSPGYEDYQCEVCNVIQQYKVK